MKPLPGAVGLPVNSINYMTGIRHIHFNMDADNTKAVIAIEISSPKEKKNPVQKNEPDFFIWFFIGVYFFTKSLVASIIGCLSIYCAVSSIFPASL